MTASTLSDASHKRHKYEHSVPLFALFIALLALTAAEVGLYEIWRHSVQAGHPIMPKVALVLVLLVVLTLPKAAIVMVYFMHLKFERQLIVLLATGPLLLVCVAVLTILSDTLILKGRGQTQNQAVQGVYHPVEGGEAGHGDAAAENAGEQHDAPADGGYVDY